MGYMPLLSDEDGDDRVQASPQLPQPAEAEAAGVPGGPVATAVEDVEVVVVENVALPPDDADPAQQDAVSIATIPPVQSPADASPAALGAVVDDTAAAAVALVEVAAAPSPPEQSEETPDQPAAGLDAVPPASS